MLFFTADEFFGDLKIDISSSNASRTGGRSVDVRLVMSRGREDP